MEDFRIVDALYPFSGWGFSSHAARKRAAQLLHDHQTPEQRRTWKEQNYMDVKGSRGTIYRIKKYGRGGSNVTAVRLSWRSPLRLWFGKRNLWVYFKAGYRDAPADDLYLSQKMLLETYESAYVYMSC